MLAASQAEAAAAAAAGYGGEDEGEAFSSGGDEMDEGGSWAGEDDTGEDEGDIGLAEQLQAEEQRAFQARLLAMAGVGEAHAAVLEDADEGPEVEGLSYEELTALGDAVGKVSKGASEASISRALAEVTFAELGPGGAEQQCPICRMEFEDGDALVKLPCGHPYHRQCAQQWLRINKICAVCNQEVPQ
jgi:E3 ubiquitin-protein ligase BIG BROTHER-like protein